MSDNPQKETMKSLGEDLLETGVKLSVLMNLLYKKEIITQEEYKKEVERFMSKLPECSINEKQKELLERIKSKLLGG